MVSYVHLCDTTCWDATRLPRADALLPDSAGRAFRVGAQARCEADAPDAQGHQGRVAAAHARQTREDGAVAGAGTAWVAWLLRGSDQLSLATAVRERLEAVVVACPPPEVAARPFHVGASRCTGTRPLAPCLHPPSVADGAICRQNSRQEPDALTGTSGSVRGVPGNRHPYRERGMWAELSSIEKGNSECRGYWYGRRQHRLRRHRASRRRAPRCQRTHARMHVQHRDRGGLRAVPAGRTPGPHRGGRQP